MDTTHTNLARVSQMFSPLATQCILGIYCCNPLQKMSRGTVPSNDRNVKQQKEKIEEVI